MAMIATEVTIATTATTLRPYQEVGRDWLLKHERAGLGDAWGLGKTAQAIAAAVPRCLIACPANVMWQWVDEIHRLDPRAGVMVAEGTAEDRTWRLREAKSRDADYTIINTEMLRPTRGGRRVSWWPDLSALAKTCTTLILDEAHHYRGRGSEQHRGAAILAQYIPRVYELTATPIYNRPDDLYALLKLLDPDRFASYWKFVKDYCRTLDLGWGPKIVGLLRGEGGSPLRRVFDRYYLTRSYKQVGLELPAMIESPMPIEPPVEWRRDYDRMRRQYKMPGDDVPMDSIMECMHALRKFTAAPKLRAVLDLIAEQRRPVLIYTWYRETANQLGRLLDCPAITGQESPRDRVTAAAAASLGKLNLVCNVAAISEGINALADYRHVIYFELDYVPGMTGQALGRVHRWSPHATELGTVHVVYPMVKKSMDTVLWEANRSKRMSAREIVQNALL